MQSGEPLLPLPPLIPLAFGIVDSGHCWPGIFAQVSWCVIKIVYRGSFARGPNDKFMGGGEPTGMSFYL